MMASIIAVFAYKACSEGDFPCTGQDFPGVSHIMGVAPLNKLYSIMLAIYSCVKQAEARAYHDRLSSFVSPTLNNFLLLCAAASFIFGPCIGYFDVYYNSHIHGQVTSIFTIGEVLYLAVLVYVMYTNMNQFEASSHGTISLCALAMSIAAVSGILQGIKY